MTTLVGVNLIERVRLERVESERKKYWSIPLLPSMSKSWRRLTSGFLPQTPMVVQPVMFSVCSHWKQNISI